MILSYIEMTILSEDQRPETETVMCVKCLGTGKTKYNDQLTLACTDCYGAGRYTLRRKRALLKGGY